METDPARDPPAATYGSRKVVVGDGGDFQVMRASVEQQAADDTGEEYDGHINRNIRLATAMIDMAKPYIWVDRIVRLKIEGVDKI